MTHTDNNTKRYRLLKDITDPRWLIPSGTIFVQKCPEKDCAYVIEDGSGIFPLHPDSVENNPEWFFEEHICKYCGEWTSEPDTECFKYPEQPKRIEVMSIREDKPMYGLGSFYLKIYFSNKVDEGKFPAIKKSIESVLNDAQPHPDNKEETKDKDWEIQCIQCNGHNYWIQEDGCYRSGAFGSNIHYEYLIAQGGTIHSVKRLSDGEVFTVGDLFTLYPNIHEYKIDGFAVDGNIIYAIQSNLKQYARRISLPHLIKLPITPSPIQKPFEDMPLLSLNDLLEVWGDGDGIDYSNAPMYKRFEQKAKEKLSGKKE